MRAFGQNNPVNFSEKHKNEQGNLSLLGGGLDGVGLELLLAGLHLFGGGAAIADAGLPHLVQGGLDGFLRPAQGVLGVGVGHLVQLAAAVLGPGG